MHLRYDKQLEFKTDLLGQALKKFKPANFESYDIRPTIGWSNHNITELNYNFKPVLLVAQLNLAYLRKGVIASLILMIA